MSGYSGNSGRRISAQSLVACAKLAGLAGTISVLVSMFAATAASSQSRPPPEPPTARAEKSLSRGTSFMVSAAHPLATRAGVEMIKAGGNAIDAAVAVQLVLGLVEPQSSGLGGGAFVLYWDRAGKKVYSYDGREKAPAAARPNRFMAGGKRMHFGKAVFSGLSIGVPGTPRLLELVHRRHGRLPWKQVFEPALRLAKAGFKITFRLHAMLRLKGAGNFGPKAQAYFFDSSGSPRPIGFLLKNPQYASTLQAMVVRGADAIYRGDIAKAIVSAVKGAPNAAGDMTLEDLAGYQAVVRPPVCSDYRDRRICGMGPPSSGGLTVAMTLKLLEGFDLGDGKGEAMSARAMHLIAETQKLAYADRNRYMADADFVAVPIKGLLDEGYLARRRALISPSRAMERPKAGRPPGLANDARGVDATIESSGTTHFSIVDRDGNAVSMTSTIESAFGSRIWAAGFLLNNELTDFSFQPVDKSGRAIANAVGPGKRPRSSMAPTLVFDSQGRFEAAVGSVGGSSIIYYVVKALVALLDWKMDAQAATDLINFGSRGRGFELEYSRDTVWQALKMKQFGHKLRYRWPIAGTHIVMRRNGILEGGADPRREGVAIGE